ncbi:ATP-binding protein [Streptomyces sp. NPDC005898]|uniref:ATP-binding protein n=1 Tax=Streptomyces sp. NPDC005898 TaxID=3157082 RepID=UPI00340074E3
MTAPTPLARPGTERPPLRPSVYVLLACLLVTAVLAGTAVTLAPASARTPLAWGAGAAALALSAAVTIAFHALRGQALARRRLAAERQESARLQREQALRSAEFTQEHARLTAAHALEVTDLTAENARIREELTSAHARARAELTAENTRLRSELTAENTRVRAELTRRARAAESERAAALAACANAAGRMQALATGMLADLRDMEGRHADEDVLTDLLHLDHRTAQAGRIADSVAVLTGARSGRRWARPIVMESILRGAMGRIGGYQRVRVHSASEVAVAGHAAEGVMHALAEILDNAANFSPPTSEVHVYIEDVAAGVIVSVEDSGLVMGPVQQRRAERAVSGEATGLGGLTGTRLGLAVVGRLARKYGLTVSFRPSARGGTGVLLLIPHELLSRPSDATRPPATTPAQLPPATPATPVAAPAQPPTTPATPGTPAPAPAQVPPATAPATPPAQLPATPGTSTPAPAHASPATAPAQRPAAPAAPGDADPTAAKDPAAAQDPVPEAVVASEAPLPKRRRGRTLAAAERGRLDSDTGENPRPRPAGAASTAARFSSFRQAVRTPAPDTTDPSGGPETPAPAQHPEGDIPR